MSCWIHSVCNWAKRKSIGYKCGVCLMTSTFPPVFSTVRQRIVLFGFWVLFPLGNNFFKQCQSNDGTFWGFLSHLQKTPFALLDLKTTLLFESKQKTQERVVIYLVSEIRTSADSNFGTNLYFLFFYVLCSWSPFPSHLLSKVRRSRPMLRSQSVCSIKNILSDCCQSW